MIELFDGNSLIGAFATIQDAVDAASAGNTIRLDAGTYNESVTVDVAVNFEGAGAGATILDGSLTPGSGLHFTGDLGDDNKVEIEGISFENYTVAGVDFDDDAILKELKIQHSHFEANAVNGVRVGGDLSPVALEKAEIKDSTFVGNGEPSGSSGDGDILFFQYYGDAKLEDLTITGQDRGTGPGENAIQFRGDAGPIGKVEIKDVTIDGIYEKQPIAIFNYSDAKDLKFKDVVVTADSVGIFNISGNFDGVGGKIDAKGLDTSGSPDIIALQGDDGDNDIKADKDSPSFLNGKGGDDKLKGSDQNDAFLGGDGDDKADGKKGDDKFDGGAGDDDLKGGDGSDGFVGGAGNDKIDGGKDFDAAIYSGSASDYDIVFKGSNKVEVTDLRGGSPDGADELKKVELLIFTQGTADVSDDEYVDVATQTTFTDEIEYRFQQGFETDTAGVLDENTAPPDDWYGTVTQVPSGTDGIPSAEGNDHAIFENADPLPFPGYLGGGYTGPFTRWGGYEDTFSGTWTTEVDVYLDATDDGGGWAAGDGFDFSSAASGSDGAHQRDYIFHVTQDTSTGDLLINASNNTNFAPREDLDVLAGTATITEDGWYTFQSVFYDDGGVLAVDMNVLDDDGALVFTKTLSSPADVIADIGGNRYGWFTTIGVDGGIAVDNLELYYADEQVFAYPTADDFC